MERAPLGNLRSFAATVAAVLAGVAIEERGLTGFVSSEFDPFLNHVFSRAGIGAREAAAALDGRPGFVWPVAEPASSEADALAREHLVPAVMHGMTASTATRPVPASSEAEIVDVRSRADLDAWHEVYCEVFGGDRRSREDWQRVHDALGPDGNASLGLLLARVDGVPAATGAVYVAEGVAGLYCFTTRDRMRGRGIASALVHASHAHAEARGIEQSVLQATALGRPVYARAGYRETCTLPVMISRRAERT